MFSAEIIAIGDELVSGDVVDINSSFLSRELALCGIATNYHTSVGDNYEEISTALKIALTRSNLILFTGGLGPTDDDITVQCITKALGRELYYDEDIWAHIKNTLQRAGRTPDIYNKSQAYVPEESDIFYNFAGTAPAIGIKECNSEIFILPGVPSEVRYFWENSLKPIAQTYADGVIKNRKIKLSGIAEAKVNELLGDVAKSQNPKIAFLPQSSEIILKLTAKGNTESEVCDLIADTEQIILEQLSEYIWGYDEDRIETTIKNIFTEKELSLSVAESCTGGLISKLLTDIPGSSKYINLNLVTYSNAAKIQMLGVDKEILDRYGAVSEDVAKQMAQGVRVAAKSNIGVGVTGIAGPTGGTETKPVGLVFVAISSQDKTEVYKIISPEKLPREEIRLRAAKKTLHLLKSFMSACSAGIC